MPLTEDLGEADLLATTARPGLFGTTSSQVQRETGSGAIMLQNVMQRSPRRIPRDRGWRHRSSRRKLTPNFDRCGRHARRMHRVQRRRPSAVSGRQTSVSLDTACGALCAASPLTVPSECAVRPPSRPLPASTQAPHQEDEKAGGALPISQALRPLSWRRASCWAACLLLHTVGGARPPVVFLPAAALTGRDADEQPLEAALTARPMNMSS